MAVGTIGKYERLDVLGHGTSGVVYLAWDTLLRRQVALKEIRAAGPELERVLEEARVLDRLGRHPHIVHVHSVDTQDGVILIDMELVKGRNLADVLRERNGDPLPPEEAVRIALDVLDALAYAHEWRILHRDVKPANILIGERGMVKLTDFGLAEALGTGSVAGGGGTYPYMAPEDFAEDADSDYRSDLWAVGIVLFEMLTGRRPFQVTTRTKDPFVWKRVIQETDAPAVTSVRPELSPAFNAVLQRALARQKTARYPSAIAFSDDLKAAVAALPRPAEPTRTQTVPESPPSSDVPAVPFVFAGGATVASTLDELLQGAAKHWDDARKALQEGRFEPFLRAIGEVYIADLARELRTRSGSADSHLREFLERSRAGEEAVASSTADAEEAGTIPVPRTQRRGAEEEGAPGERRRAFPGFRRRPAPPIVDAVLPKPTSVVAPPVPVPKTQETNGVIMRWWFWPLFLFCLGPLATALASNSHMTPGQMGQFSDLFEAWTVSGALSAMLLIVGIGARFPVFARITCAIPTAAGLVAAGALVSQSFSHQPNLDTIIHIAVLLLTPLVLLMIEAATTVRLWRFWGWAILVAAFLATQHYAR